MSDTPEANRLESLALTAIFAGLSLGLLALIGTATRSGPASAGWWTQPWLMPGVALVLLAGANAVSLARDLWDLRQRPPTPQERAEGRAAVLGWLKPLEFLTYFAGYVWAIQHLGYALSTLAFVGLLLARTGLTAPKWWLAGLGLVLFMLVFRIGLGVWMPAPEFYDLFPDAVRLRLIRWF